MTVSQVEFAPVMSRRLSCTSAQARCNSSASLSGRQSHPPTGGSWQLKPWRTGWRKHEPVKHHDLDREVALRISNIEMFLPPVSRLQLSD